MRHADVKILLANDDGYRAEGLRFLREALMGVAPLTVVAYVLVKRLWVIDSRTAPARPTPGRGDLERQQRHAARVRASRDHWAL